MTFPLLSAQNAIYVLDQFDAGVSPQQILAALHAAGYIGMEYYTIEEYLHQNGHITYQKQPTNIIHGQSLLRVERASTSSHNVNITLTSTESRAVQAPLLSWNTQADTFALSAHKAGQTVPQISAQLCQNGIYN